MKKLFAVLALVGVMTSCKDKKKDEKKPEETTTTTPSTTEATTTTTTTTETSVSSDIPKFADAVTTSLVAAYTSKDMTNIASLSPKAAEWASKSMDVSKKLMANPDDAAKFTAYMSKLSDQITAAMATK